MIKIKRLDNLGIASHMAMVLVVAITACLGTYFILAGHAEAPIKYSTPISRRNTGAIYGCRTADAVYLKIINNTGSYLSYWFDDQPATNLTLKPHATTYLQIELKGEYFEAAVNEAGQGGYAIATFSSGNILNCTTDN